MNHFSLNLPPSDTLWYTPMDHHHHHHHQLHQQNKSLPLFYSLNNFSQNDDDSDNSTSNNHNYAAVSNDNRSETTSSQSQHERMFEKPLTPSDVGKLNRLVIPKQHAEKYFPLAGVSAAAAADGGGGVLLGFEDETGKCWRFRYSYWNSSQSYVLTKGWSRYVKEKKLDAGDVVLFERHRFESDRFFIGWRRRGSTAPVHLPVRPLYNAVQVRQGYSVPPPQRIAAASFPYQAVGCFHAGTGVRPPTQKAARSGSGGGNSKKLRLFGVNLECQLEDDDDDAAAEPQTSDGSSLSSQGPNHGSGSGSGAGPATYNYFDYAGYTRNHHHNHMDVNFPEDVNQMRNQMG